MSEPSHPRKTLILELGVPTFLIGVAAVFLWDSKNITGTAFDSLGPAPIPRLICWMVILLCGVIIGQTLYAHRSATASETDEESEAEAPACQAQPLLAGAMLGLTVAYVIAMVYRVASFAIVTTVFLILAIGVLNRFEKKGMLIALIIALIMGFGCQYLFTEIFVIDLPTGVE